MKKKNEQKMKLGAIKVARLNAGVTPVDQQQKKATHPTTTVIRTFDC
ncbi:hypothetical protein SAMN05660461_5717 [Chitinophaga ginsengisegetis]|uniref:Uncharacterized protein n=1 Tax=Chitinophaga ginsengisegetis TaxID=393003 RepID=A0A1T5PAR5_9BACT|nr:hypothetical protein [Chitinophaga ginsengisegetis]MDR6570034.1 hypothetical protein [Chitinophaga ginsengisegetis]MDR6649768.1 hypothetical protein [Chitinophaga ginsengisegetis]MDR6656029.1 hypothetical protein [Chitinophaga ginsengisegetis]SKD09825.1 hypothetical protein SAMN05660461_5717 [Chitinophaga ginsengisegetis]